MSDDPHGIDEDWTLLEHFLNKSRERGHDIAVPTRALVAIQYLDSQGASEWTWHVLGDRHVLATVGMIEVLKVQMLAPIIGDELEADD